MARHDPAPKELDGLRALSARIGADPLLVQAAGGNTSLKSGDILWIKASGTWLAHARDKDIMVPVSLDLLHESVARGDAAAEKPQGFVVDELNPCGLRPSIETSVHAVIPRRVVVHVHCVETIAIAVRNDAETILAERLDGLAWAFVPYVKPGLSLARAISERLRPGTDILVLGNHGLVVAAETVPEAEALLMHVHRLLAQPARTAPAYDPQALARLAEGGGYRLPTESAVHAAACDPVSCRIAGGGSLYPDHVIFIGRGSTIAMPGENAAAVARAAAAMGEPPPVSILFPGTGVLMRGDATPGAEALALCLSHVTARLPDGAPLNYLSEEENVALLDWDAEKYRQRLNQSAEAGR